MPLGEPKGRPKCSRKTIGIVAFVHTGITQRPLNVPCAMSEKVNTSVLFILKLFFFVY